MEAPPPLQPFSSLASYSSPFLASPASSFLILLLLLPPCPSPFPSSFSFFFLLFPFFLLLLPPPSSCFLLLPPTSSSSLLAGGEGRPATSPRHQGRRYSAVGPKGQARGHIDRGRSAEGAWPRWPWASSSSGWVHEAVTVVAMGRRWLVAWVVVAVAGAAGARGTVVLGWRAAVAA